MSTKTLLTSEDLWKLVADGSRHELSKGELLLMTPVGMEHGAIVIKLGRLLSAYTEENRSGLVVTEAGFRLSRNPDTVRAPDVAFVPRDRLPMEGVPKKFADFPPELAVEVLSPEDTASEMVRKVEEYLAGGVRLVWVVDPGTKTVTVYYSLQDAKILTADQELDGGNVLPGFRAKMTELFAI
ncbi:MAG: Uma2 family endonuclease [Acidobacteria bacterium]|nr:Uma2 family endonuclease [Acidobacteriota bacterium]